MNLHYVIWFLSILMISPWLFESISLAEHPNTVANHTSNGPLTESTEIVERMLQYAQWRDASLAGYTNIREYHVEYQGIIDKKADMVVRMIYTSPDEKQVEVISESGSKLLRNRVLRRILESEIEAEQNSNRQESAIHPDNYSFRPIAPEPALEDDCYILEAVPKKKTKFLFEGKIWIDRKDFAIVRIEGKPAKKPSWWIEETSITHTYRKVGGFWLHSSNESHTKVRLVGGRALLTIRYGDYEIRESETSMCLSSGR